MTSTPQLISALYKRYPMNKGAWACIVEFERIDFLSVATWASNDYEVHGHEIKASRGDWLKELKSPGKAVNSMALCDFWWLAADKGIAKDDEIPAGWGFMEFDGISFRRRKSPQRLRPALEKRWSPCDLSAPHHPRRAFAAMARRYAYAQADRDALYGAVESPTPYLNSAALATGRFTAEQRAEQAEWSKRQREMAKEYKRA